MPCLLDTVGYGLLDVRQDPVFNGSYGLDPRQYDPSSRLASCHNIPMRSVPAHFTRRKQKGKSSTLSARYTPTADHPYSRESFRNLPLRDNDSSAPLGPLVCDRRDQDQLKLRFCVLESKRCGVDVPRFLHACEPRVNADACACPANRAVAVGPPLDECILLTEVGVGFLAALQLGANSFWKVEVFVEVPVVGRKGWRPGIEGRSARIMMWKCNLSKCA